MKNKALKWFFTHNKTIKVPLIILSIISILLSGFAVLFAYISKLVIDAAEASNISSLTFYGIIAVSIMAMQLIFSAINKYMRGFYIAKSDRTLKNVVYEALLSSEYKSLSTYHSGTLMNYLTSDVEKVSTGLVEAIPRFLFIVFRFLFAFVLLIYLDALFALIMLVAGIILFIGALMLRPLIKKRHHNVQNKEASLRSFIQESFSNLAIIKSFDAERYMQNKTNAYQQGYFDARLKKTKLNVFSSTALNAFFAFGFAFALLFGAYRITQGVITFGTLVALMQLINQIQSPFSNMSTLIPQYYTSLTSAERLMYISGLDKESKASLKIHDFKSLVFEDVSFSYGDVAILKDFSFQIDQGDVIHIKGPSGIGKTTILTLLLGLNTPSSGRIMIKTRDKDLDLSPSTRNLFSYVPQNHLIFSGTIKDNVTFNLEDKTEKEIYDALDSAGILNTVKNLPNGLDTKLGEKGHGLSEGQIQRLAIARGLLKNSPILLLDEVTASLDEAAEKIILDNINHLKNKTIIIISHRELPKSLVTKQINL